MANSSAPFGFPEDGPGLRGGSYTAFREQFNIHSSDANLYFTNDLVSLSSEGGSYITISNGSTSAQLPLGKFDGCEYLQNGRMQFARHYPGSVGSDAANGVTRCWVVTDPNALFIGAGGSTTSFFTAADVGMNATIVLAQSSLGNTVTGQSAMILSSATAASASFPWKIVDLWSNRAVPTVGFGTESSAYNWVVLQPNGWTRSGFGTVGLSS